MEGGDSPDGGAVESQQTGRIWDGELGLLPSEVTLILCMQSCAYMLECVRVYTPTQQPCLRTTLMTAKRGWRGEAGLWGLTELDTIEET